MRQSVYLALIGAASAIRISQTSMADCTWTAKGGFSSGDCDNGTAKCGSQAEKDANPAATGTKRSCDHTKAL